jgi:hydroxymethylglutaryl-CoA lyase
VDASVGGLGGCPYAPGASGNVSTEDVVFALHGIGYETGVDLPKVAGTGEWISKQLGRPTAGRAGRATIAKLEREATNALNASESAREAAATH